MGNVEIPNWLKGLPLAPEFRPTDTEFADPIAYISKIEKEASAFGICKIIPPLPKPSKKYVFHNLNKSLSKCPELGYNVHVGNASNLSKMRCENGGNEEEVRALFTTRHQELGQNVKRAKGVGNSPQMCVQKQVWQSGEIYTLEQFESKSKAFVRSTLGTVKEVSPLVVEAMFWKAASEKPIHVEYANDVPGTGFGEPECQFRNFHRRRRKRRNYRTRESFDCKNVDSRKDLHSDEIKDVSIKNDPNTRLELSESAIASSTLSLDEASRSSRQTSLNAGSEMEGTAGWKLSNSPWNLQVIARSPGSLTRFMPDDIPGVTSPMVYIGMLYSWFAWHVEDHELHSMNFLHTGSSKTWYAVPGDCAYAFEQVLRNEAYGGNIDRLAALTVLGEKTTLLSPEVIVGSGIPGCRLVQNPGEFVVTFPRAYHMGFSHGFNCGEAANFGTPQWLKVAKEAAVRRAAMNYLPMLSHQQLLYLLTMSFVSRVPRSLLPGGRSSRLRDRQKEERELSVKKAFIEDMLNENNLLSILLGRESIYHAVLWDPDLLPSLRKESQLPCLTSTVSTTPAENVSNIHSENDKSSNLLDEMSLYMETLNDLYMDDDDISCDFQVDSGTLACVACGILGFPFMSVVHPSEKTSMELLPADHILVRQGQGVSKPVNCHSSPVHDGSIKGSVSDNLPPLHGISPSPKESITNIEVGWNASSGFLRPRIFCLEHAVQIEEMLRSKGGANVLVICHSDYQKIKAHAVVIAEEINSPFNYIEIPLDNASQEDLNLIDLAIDDEHHDECGEEWTSKLGINLRYSVKVRKNSPSMQVQHALTLSGLFSDESLSSDFFNINWQARRSRSKIKSNNPARHNPCEILQKNDKVFGRGLDGVIVKKEEKILQYSRRNFKSKPCGSSRGHGLPRKHLPAEVSGDIFGDLDKHGREESENNLCNDGNTENSSAVTDLSASIRMSEMQHEIVVLEVTTGSSVPTQVAESLVTASSVCGHVKVEVRNQTSEEMATSGCLKREHKIRVTEITSEKNEMPSAEGSDSPLSLAGTESFEMQKDYQIMEKINIMNGAYNLVTRDHPESCSDVQADGDVSMNELPDLDVHTSWPVSVPLMGSCDAKMENADVEKFLDDPEGCHDVQVNGYVSMNELPDLDVRTCLTVAEPLVESFDAEMENADVEKVRINSENCDCVAIDNEVQERIQTTERSNEKEPASSNAKVINWPTASLQESSGNTRVTCASENTCIDASLANEIQQDMKSKNESNEDESISSNTEIINQPAALMDENSEVTKEHSAAADLCNDVIIYNEVHLEIQSSNDSIEEKPVSSNVTLINQPPASVIESSESPRETIAAVNFCKGESLDDEVDLGMKRTNVNNEEEPISSYVTPMNQHTPASTEVNQPILVSVEECSEVPGGTCAEEILCSGLTSDTAIQLEIPTANETNKEETISNFVMQKEAIQPVSVLLEESLEIPREVCAKDNPGGGVILDDEVQQKNRSTGGSTEEGPSFSCGAVIYEPTLASIQECSEIKRETRAAGDNKELEGIKSTAVEPSSSAEKGRKRKREMEQKTESIFNCNGFIRSPCEGLRPRAGKDTGHRSRIDISNTVEENPVKKRLRKPSEVSNPRKEKKENTNGSHIHRCDLEGCRMSFKSKPELLLHKRNRCPVPECKKRFSSHKYAVLHQRVHDDDRPLKCPWKGCSMSFKWAWARTEHIRVHTGERPYQCKVENCGLSFRFVSDFSRHRRKTGHYVNSKT